ncbi:hypothetical protein [Shivajiella indica]|uniref:Uncharacterized protein n=1 Tax=Shivajiella indica TaxID=872115 RepID=A0ABW5B5D6_9BACT
MESPAVRMENEELGMKSFSRLSWLPSLPAEGRLSWLESRRFEEFGSVGGGFFNYAEFHSEITESEEFVVVGMSWSETWKFDFFFPV